MELYVPEAVAYSHADLPTDYSVILSGIPHRNLSEVRWQLDESKKRKKGCGNPSTIGGLLISFFFLRYICNFYIAGDCEVI